MIVQQLFAEVKGDIGPGITAGVRIGRQDFQDGPIQLVSIQENPNIHITFDGVRAYATGKRARLGVFDLRYTRLGTDAFDDPTDHSRRFSGATASFMVPTKLLGASKLYFDPFFYYLRNRNQRWGSVVAREERRFWGARLSDAALALLKSVDRIVGSEFVFAGTTKAGCLSDMALNQFVRKLNGDPARYVDPEVKDEQGEPRPIVPHGMRSSFRDWAGEDTSHDREVIEHALAHRLKDKAEAAYRRSTAMAKRAKLMQEWADYCAKNTLKVVALEIAA